MRSRRSCESTRTHGNLPDCRVRPSNRAFSHCGIDYAGPIQIRSTPGRGHKSRKAYIAVSVCTTIKAIHLELMSDCSTPAFIAAFDRFCARRRLPSQVYSDNATNFQDARNELAAIWRPATRDSNVINNLSDKGIEWVYSIFLSALRRIMRSMRAQRQVSFETRNWCSHSNVRRDEYIAL